MEIDHYKVMKTFEKTLLSYFDIITDVLILVDLIQRNSRMALVQGISLGVSFLFQSVLSLVVLKYPDQRTALQFVSLLASFLTTGFVMASSDREFNKCKYRRKNEPLLFDNVPDTNSHRQMVAFVSFFSLYKLAKVSSLALLISASSFRYAVNLLTLEFFGFLGWRKVYGNWRWYKKGLDGIPFSLFTHFCCYICLLSAPFLWYELQLTPSVIEYEQIIRERNEAESRYNAALDVLMGASSSSSFSPSSTVEFLLLAARRPEPSPDHDGRGLRAFVPCCRISLIIVVVDIVIVVIITMANATSRTLVLAPILFVLAAKPFQFLFLFVSQP
ncbi:hypothetical protein TL16_g03274 [Triparma laevis f. inornata]|uniref:Uncharacterized protein n=1 Tax=Triparma laevis f. inornata TaxID=1714386 RepID=A0A9W6ZW36_9STRA|nr:hypothetical protein TL16_g03274 [Triparma laevis f. inornata]